MSYKDLESYQNALVICDFTVEFCKKDIDIRSRIKDQMEQAGRSGKQNIVEGASSKNLSSHLKLTMVARSSLEELLEDYRDFLRQRRLTEWPKESAEARVVRNLVYRNYKSYNTYQS